jgi:hypothetical protein
VKVLKSIVRSTTHYVSTYSHRICYVGNWLHQFVWCKCYGSIAQQVFMLTLSTPPRIDRFVHQPTPRPHDITITASFIDPFNNYLLYCNRTSGRCGKDLEQKSQISQQNMIPFDITFSRLSERSFSKRERHSRRTTLFTAVKHDLVSR